MKKTSLSCLALLSLSLTACSPMPKECAETWEKMETLAKSMGISDEQLKQQKKQFENEVKHDARHSLRFYWTINLAKPKLF